MTTFKSKAIISVSMFMSTACFNTASSLSPADAQTVMMPLKVVPLEQIAKDGSIAFDIVVPSETSWKKIRAAWGDPGYLISIVSPDRRTLTCFDKHELDVRLSDDSGAIHSESANSPLYGYSSECINVGTKFNASPGDRVRLQVTYSGRPPQLRGDLMVTAYWGPEIKDKLVGLSINEELRHLF